MRVYMYRCINDNDDKINQQYIRIIIINITRYIYIDIYMYIDIGHVTAC